MMAGTASAASACFGAGPARGAHLSGAGRGPACRGRGRLDLDRISLGGRIMMISSVVKLVCDDGPGIWHLPAISDFNCLVTGTVPSESPVTDPGPGLAGRPGGAAGPAGAGRGARRP